MLDDLFVDMEPVEDLFGGGSRTRHIILKRRYGTLSQSIFSCKVGDKIVPNRDYPYEGIFSLSGNSYWKYIDMVPIGVISNGKALDLKPLNVRASPWKCEYGYEAEGRKLLVSYYLEETSGGALGFIDATVSGENIKDIAIIFRPYFDIRFMYDASMPDSHNAGIEAGILCVKNRGHDCCVKVEGSGLTRAEERIEWDYKLGSGYRIMNNGQIRFVPEKRTVRSFYEFMKKGPSATLKFSCGQGSGEALRLINKNFSGLDNDIKKAMRIKGSIFGENENVDKRVLFRVIAMTMFDMDIDGISFQEAGDFWFKAVWFRDQFEGILNNYNTIKKLNGLKNVKLALLKSFDYQDKYGRIPNNIAPSGEAKFDYNSVDASLLAFMLAGMLVRDTNDGELAISSIVALKKFIDGVNNGELLPDGPPILRPEGLLSVPSWHSWTDGKRDIDGHKLPIRVKIEWEKELIGSGQTGELDLQKFFLPEINAMWIRALESGWLFSKYIRDYKTSDLLKKYYYRATGSYKNIFYDSRAGYINNVVTTDDYPGGILKDNTPGSPGVVSAAILGQDIFTQGELRSIANIAIGRLMRTKWGMPFGLIVNDSGKSIYFNDDQYHEAVVWPRDTPYFIKLLRHLGEEDIIGGLLESNLRHQMEEGFVFYNGELFSCDNDLVPVKNPVQWWSQWTDPYIFYTH
jgi:hypothetical protein